MFPASLCFRKARTDEIGCLKRNPRYAFYNIDLAFCITKAGRIMLIALLWSLSHQQQPRYSSSSPSVTLIRATKAEAQFAPLPPPLPHPSATLLPPPLLPLQAPPQLDTRLAQEYGQEDRDEQDLIAAINKERETRGLRPLTLDPLLTATARAHSREMCDLDYFDHESPTPACQTPLDRYLVARRVQGQEPPHAALVGENLFYASVTDGVYNAGYAHTALMASPEHRANILEPRFTKVGVGLYRDSEGRFWVTEMFLRASQ
jgi:uncharacterized protein YkwD